MVRLMEDLHVAWIDDLDAIHDIAKCPIGGRNKDLVVLPQFPQRTKEGVPMGGDPDIPPGARKGCTADMPGGNSKNFRCRAFENHH